MTTKGNIMTRKNFIIAIASLVPFVSYAEIYIQSRETVPAFTTEHGETIRELTGIVSGKTFKHSVALVDFVPGGASINHFHPVIEESYFVLEGEGRLVIDGETAIIKQGQLVVIPPKAHHQVFNDSADKVLKLYVVAAEAWTPDSMIPVK
jgi:mannose-6-phosphate isomerase-like protein (cupin superfamily)